jgi:hypothetical protein
MQVRCSRTKARRCSAFIMVVSVSLVVRVLLDLEFEGNGAAVEEGDAKNGCNQEAALLSFWRNPKIVRCF